MSHATQPHDIRSLMAATTQADIYAVADSCGVPIGFLEQLRLQWKRKLEGKHPCCGATTDKPCRCKTAVLDTRSIEDMLAGIEGHEILLRGHCKSCWRPTELRGRDARFLARRGRPLRPPHSPETEPTI